MFYPQLLVYETDRLVAGGLCRLAEERNWILREPRQMGTCLRLLRRAHPAVLVIKVGTDVVREMTVLERVRWLRPHTYTIVVGDLENAALAGLAWDLGASYVLLPPQPRNLLPEVVIALMERAIDRCRSSYGKPAKAATDLERPAVPAPESERP